MRKGFTLIELLVVVGIIAILAIAALIAINPLEAQRRSRDSARLQDMARLSSVIEAFINDFGQGSLPITLKLSGGTDAAPANVGLRSDNCQGVATSWLGANNFCDYIKQVPFDPQNGRPISTLTAVVGTRAQHSGGYGFISVPTGANPGYELCTYLEANRSQDLLGQDSGNNAGVFEAGINTSNIACTPS